MIDYELITGKKEDVVKTVKKMLNEGWIPLDLTSTTIGSAINYTQALTREVSESLIVEDKPKRTRR